MIKKIQIIAVIIMMSSCSSMKWTRTNKSDETALTEAEKTKFNSYFYKALDQKETGQYAEALETYRMCYKIDSLDAGLLTEISTLYSVANMHEEALRLMTIACKNNEHNWWLNRRLITLYSNAKEPEKALVIARKLQKAYPYKEEIYHIQAALYKDNKQPNKAIAVYDQLEKITGIEESLAFQKFYLYAEQEKITKAVAEIDRLVNKYPTNSKYKVIRGDIYMQQKMPKEAFEIYQGVLNTDPENPYIYMSLSEYYQLEGQPEKAIESTVNALKNPQLAVDEKIEILGQHVQNIIRDSARFNETDSLFGLLIEHYPLEEQVQGYYSIYLQYRNRIPEAIDALESMILINPKNPQSWLQIIQLQLAERKFEEVISVSNRAIEYLPETSQFYFYKGLSLFQTDKLLEAMHTISLGLATIPENKGAMKSDFYAQMGDIHFKLKNDSAAFAAYEQALQHNPANVYVMNNYAYYLSEMNKDIRKAELMSAKTIEKDPSNSTYLDTYAWIFYKQANYTLAKFYIEKAIDNLNDELEPGVIYEHYGDILWKRGDKEKALEMWKKAWDSGNKNEELKTKIENKKMLD